MRPRAPVSAGVVIADCGNVAISVGAPIKLRLGGVFSSSIFRAAALHQARGTGRAAGARCHPAGNQFVALVELAIEHLCDFGDGMVGDAGANAHWLESLIGTQFPNYGHVHARSARLLTTLRASTTLRTLTASAPLFAVSPGGPRCLTACRLGSSRLS